MPILVCRSPTIQWQRLLPVLVIRLPKTLIAPLVELVEQAICALGVYHIAASCPRKGIITIILYLQCLLPRHYHQYLLLEGKNMCQTLQTGEENSGQQQQCGPIPHRLGIRLLNAYCHFFFLNFHFALLTLPLAYRFYCTTSNTTTSKSIYQHTTSCHMDFFISSLLTIKILFPFDFRCFIRTLATCYMFCNRRLIT